MWKACFYGGAQVVKIPPQEGEVVTIKIVFSQFSILFTWLLDLSSPDILNVSIFVSAFKKYFFAVNVLDFITLLMCYNFIFSLSVFSGLRSLMEGKSAEYNFLMK